MSLYQLLGVDSKVATEADIRTAFRSRAVAESPARGGDADHFAQLKVAYETLVDPKRRAVYDAECLSTVVVAADSQDGWPQDFASNFRGGSVQHPHGASR